MSAMQRRKGADGEREICRLMRVHGWTDAFRTSDGRNQLERGDIGNGPEGVYIEVRRREKLSIWDCYAEAERQARPIDIPSVFFRRSRSPWLACLEVDELLPLLRMREVG